MLGGGSQKMAEGYPWVGDNGCVDVDPEPAAALPVAFNDQGLVPVVVQETTTRDVLMLAWMDEEALSRTLRTGRATYWSRSRQAYWVKGETSGNHQHVVGARLDCDGDTVLLTVDQTGPACHTGAETCFATQPVMLAKDVDSDG